MAFSVMTFLCENPIIMQCTCAFMLASLSQRNVWYAKSNFMWKSLVNGSHIRATCCPWHILFVDTNAQRILVFWISLAAFAYHLLCGRGEYISTSVSRKMQPRKQLWVSLHSQAILSGSSRMLYLWCFFFWWANERSKEQEHFDRTTEAYGYRLCSDSLCGEIEKRAK